MEKTLSMRRFLFMFVVLLVAIPAAAAADVVYKVRKGDNLFRIAKKFRVTPDDIMEANGLESDLLKPGDRLSIPAGLAEPEMAAPRTAESKPSADTEAALSPAVKTFYHKVEKGETLTSIADRYGMTVKRLKAMNRIRSPRKLRAGALILVRQPVLPEQEEAGAPAAGSPESQLARELKELAESPPVNEGGDHSGPGKGPGSSAIKEKLIRIAQKMLDIPYRFGGSSFLGIDCSGYVQKVFGLLDVVLPRTAREQFRLGEKVDKEDLSAGDLVFFRTYAKYPSHVGIYLGNNEFIHASSRDRRVKIDSLDVPYYHRRFIGARRLPLEEPAEEI